MKLNNPVVTGFQSLSMEMEEATITDATDRKVKFVLSKNNELLEVQIRWGDKDNQRPKDIEQVALWHQCYDATGLMVPDTYRAMVVPFSSNMSNRCYSIAIMTPEKARFIEFNCSYVNITVAIMGRIRFKGYPNDTSR
ncbi:hypothetical protein [Vibrio neptunius]|uniref:hypothetical protein n=1 Tax=Vibrio neptunius TaxID=170651 RepID=UPI0019D0D563|nr:hypothetical protein [Vibrio neptunius]MBN3571891.1 hypothetical protein [Vibrio neptunius]